jgi:hypothetical protein
MKRKTLSPFILSFSANSYLRQVNNNSLVSNTSNVNIYTGNKISRSTGKLDQS